MSDQTREELLAEIEQLKAQVRQCTLVYMPEDIQRFVVSAHRAHTTFGLTEMSEDYYVQSGYGVNDGYNRMDYLVKRGFAVVTYKDKHPRKSHMNDIEWHQTAFGNLYYYTHKFKLTEKGMRLAEAIIAAQPVANEVQNG